MAIAKPAGTWRYEDLLALPDDGTRYEVIDGELYEMPSPNIVHATVMVNLVALLLPVAASIGARLFFAPFDVFFRGADPVQPDILVVLPNRFGDLVLRGMEGAPNLVIEVLSPSNPRHDTVRKRDLYARGGVDEYWIVDADARTLEILVLDGSSYRSRRGAADDVLVTSTVLPDIAFPAAAVFAGIPE